MDKIALKFRVSLVVTTFFLCSGQVAANDLEESLLACADLSNKQQRFTCYDVIGQKLVRLRDRSTLVPVVQEEMVNDSDLNSDTNSAIASGDAVVEIKNDVKAQSESHGLPSDLGGGLFRKKGKASGPKVLAYGNVVSCEKSATGKWLFIFDSGQVWRQVDSSRRNYRACDFRVAIIKDGIGFKIKLDGENKSMRVRRKR